MGSADPLSDEASRLLAVLRDNLSDHKRTELVRDRDDTKTPPVNDLFWLDTSGHKQYVKRGIADQTLKELSDRGLISLSRYEIVLTERGRMWSSTNSEPQRSDDSKVRWILVAAALATIVMAFTGLWSFFSNGSTEDGLEPAPPVREVRRSCRVSIAELTWSNLGPSRIGEHPETPGTGECNPFEMTAFLDEERLRDDGLELDGWTEVSFEGCYVPGEGGGQGLGIVVETASGNDLTMNIGPLEADDLHLPDTDGDGIPGKRQSPREPIESITLEERDKAQVATGGWFATCSRSGANLSFNYRP